MPGRAKVGSATGSYPPQSGPPKQTISIFWATLRCNKGTLAQVDSRLESVNSIEPIHLEVCPSFGEGGICTFTKLVYAIFTE